MGLDQYMYAAAKMESETSDKIAYFRKHPNLHGFMQQLYESKTGDTDPGNFNGVELELTFQDLDQLEETTKQDKLPPTTGFFFGGDSDDEYKESLLEAVRDAKFKSMLGLKIFYNSSW